MSIGDIRRSCVRHLGLHSARNHDKMLGGATKKGGEYNGEDGSG